MFGMIGALLGMLIVIIHVVSNAINKEHHIDGILLGISLILFNITVKADIILDKLKVIEVIMLAKPLGQ